MATVGIFGFGRIGRNLFRLLYPRDDLRIGAVADLAEPEGVEYLLRFDTLLGRFPDELSAKDGFLYVRRAAHSADHRQDPAARPGVGRARRRHGPRGDLARPPPRGSRGAPPGRREARDPARAAARAARRDDRPGRQRRGPLGLAPHDLERLVDGALPRPGAPRSSTTPSACGARSSRRSTPTRARTASPTSRPRTSAAAAPPPRTSSRRSPAPPPCSLDLCPSSRGRLSGYAMNVPVSNGSVVDLVCWHEQPGSAGRDQRGRPRRRPARAAGGSVLHYEDEPIVSSDVARSQLLRRRSTRSPR